MCLDLLDLVLLDLLVLVLLALVLLGMCLDLLDLVLLELLVLLLMAQAFFVHLPQGMDHDHNSAQNTLAGCYKTSYSLRFQHKAHPVQAPQLLLRVDICACLDIQFWYLLCNHLHHHT